MFMDEFWARLKAILLSFSNYVSKRQKGSFIICGQDILGEIYPHFLENGMRPTTINAWPLQKKLIAIFRALVLKSDWEWLFIAGSILKAHQHSSGAANEQETAIGKSVAGNITKSI
jgi:hypothetical protein